MLQNPNEDEDLIAVVQERLAQLDDAVKVDIAELEALARAKIASDQRP